MDVRLQARFSRHRFELLIYRHRQYFLGVLAYRNVLSRKSRFHDELALRPNIGAAARQRGGGAYLILRMRPSLGAFLIY